MALTPLLGPFLICGSFYDCGLPTIAVAPQHRTDKPLDRALRENRNGAQRKAQEAPFRRGLTDAAQDGGDADRLIFRRQIVSAVSYHACSDLCHAMAYQAPV